MCHKEHQWKRGDMHITYFAEHCLVLFAFLHVSFGYAETFWVFPITAIEYYRVSPEKENKQLQFFLLFSTFAKQYYCWGGASLVTTADQNRWLLALQRGTKTLKPVIDEEKRREHNQTRWYFDILSLNRVRDRRWKDGLSIDAINTGGLFHSPMLWVCTETQQQRCIFHRVRSVPKSWSLPHQSASAVKGLRCWKNARKGMQMLLLFTWRMHNPYRG